MELNDGRIHKLLVKIIQQDSIKITDGKACLAGIGPITIATVIDARLAEMDGDHLKITAAGRR